MNDGGRKKRIQLLREMSNCLASLEKNMKNLKESEFSKDTDNFAMNMFEDLEKVDNEDKAILDEVSRIRKRFIELTKQLSDFHVDYLRKVELKEKQITRGDGLYVRDREGEGESREMTNAKKSRKDIVIDVNSGGMIINNAFITNKADKINENANNQSNLNVSMTLTPATCVKQYAIPGDGYNFVFYPNEYKTGSNYYFSIGSSTFYAFEKAFGFEYLKYKKFVNDIFSTSSKLGVMFDPNDENKGIVGNWKHNLSDTNVISAVHVWASLTKITDSTPPNKMRYYFHIAKGIENLTDDQYVVLSFGQFQKISPFMRKYIFKKNKYWRTWSKYQSRISVTSFCCKFHNSKRSNKKNEKWSDDCNKELTVLMDMLHRFVIFKISGFHGEDCDELNRSSGYTEFRNLLLNANVVDQEEALNKVRAEYSDCFEDVVLKMGQLPTTIDFSNWTTQRGRIV